MEGRVLWYKPTARRGSLVSDAGQQFSFRTTGRETGIRDGTWVSFKVSETDGRLIGVRLEALPTLPIGFANTGSA